MSLLQRLKNTLSADAHGLVDALEDPTLLLQQHFRDAEAEVLRKRAQLSELELESKRLGTQRERANADAERAEQDSALALQQDRDDLARYALKQLLTQRQLSERLNSRLLQIADERLELSRSLESQQAALEELRTRIQAHLSASESGGLERDFKPVSEEQIELELLRRKHGKDPNHG